MAKLSPSKTAAPNPIKTYGFVVEVNATRKIIVDDIETPLWDSLKQFDFVDSINVTPIEFEQKEQE